MPSDNNRQRRPVQPLRPALLLAGAVALFSTTHAVAETMCRPALRIEQARFSEPGAQQRVWSAILTVDASSCATTSGHFYVNFVRLKEMAPDLLFSEEFTWSSGRIEISMEFWLDEAVLEYWIGYVPICPCRN